MRGDHSHILRRDVGMEVTRPGDPDTLDASEVAFVLCVEANRLEPQARLLCESIRTFAGGYRTAPIIAVSPRGRLALGADARAVLESLQVQYVVEPLNETAISYGTVNRIVVGAWAEAHLSSSHLVVLDTDTIFVDEPCFPRADVAVRPVDLKGTASSGDGDPLDRYWARMCAFGGIDTSTLPWLATTIDDVRIRASYNGGFTLVRRDLGILRHTADVFLRSVTEDLRPRAGIACDVFASTGFVGQEASEWWGSSQAALSVGIWARASDVRIMDAAYNIPLHLLTDTASTWPTGLGGSGLAPILLHYHYLAEAEYRAQLGRAMRAVGCASSALRWMEERLGLFQH